MSRAAWKIIHTADMQWGLAHQHYPMFGDYAICTPREQVSYVAGDSASDYAKFKLPTGSYSSWVIPNGPVVKEDYMRPRSDYQRHDMQDAAIIDATFARLVHKHSH